MKKELSWFNLPSLSIPVKALFTGYILVVGLGLLMAGLQIMLTHGMADGKWGISVDDIVYSYYGNPNGSKIESKLNGSMKDKAPPEERLVIIKWAREGANKTEWQANVKPIVEKRCAMCHAHMPTLPNISQFETISELAQADKGASVENLTRVSHIHLFGISFIFFFVGFIFSLAVGFNKWLKAGLIIFPFLFLIMDISAWWLTKINPNFAWFVIIGGFGYSVASSVMLFTSLYQMWIYPMKKKSAVQNTWYDEN
ncbi:elongation factor-1 alpha [Thiomicrorhabdus heinhorstiae]|uniref:Elongation factor-1 alpha n=1 Tax=Thiomicrorhabdus heinhorstiae TaxID=2748010 RepID=A0ABS0BX48_9GAMM|nr:elongation factor-1 alpha [Thiomicrorhabdus heinhorstiae]MBF6057668.1 elongation factor-1 alpha [Thiomicrorhabdus heinhorstiae]